VCWRVASTRQWVCRACGGQRRGHYEGREAVCVLSSECPLSLRTHKALAPVNHVGRAACFRWAHSRKRALAWEKETEKWLGEKKLTSGTRVRIAWPAVTRGQECGPRVCTGRGVQGREAAHVRR